MHKSISTSASRLLKMALSLLNLTISMNLPLPSVVFPAIAGDVTKQRQPVRILIAL